MLRFEQEYWSTDCIRIAGIDEAGRGPLAGPVVAAALIFNRDYIEREQSNLFERLTDSKKLTENQRNTFYDILTDNPLIDVGIGVSEATEIDQINILRATHAAMLRAVQKLTSPPDHILVDGLAVKTLPEPVTPIVKGDSKSISIAAASVVAKVFRDRIMLQLDKDYPVYRFAKHKGYGTGEHMQALLENGPCPAHRRSFRPVREAENLNHREDGVAEHRTNETNNSENTSGQQMELF